ncbi:hypothetical protein CIL05_12660 [Virgibacillus profundi]|uniref:Uncharacterized protein n=1 Tax=Virgibacillus profundi TaxID=2024555 RepID=A0A2A2IB66_9BACI|nr:spore germination protein GerPE [Virgibacillus profundi]PAV29241.1 hypothetical protein CIL05_12660 [Virgibacillus profundi]PXY53410.1 spore germination protein GerPE [Virgibacillus profundi]
MEKRTAEISNIRTISISYSSIFTIGDTVTTTQKSRGIAVQQEGATFTKEDNLHFRDYPIFNREANWLKPKYSVHTNTIHHAESIHVQNVSLIGVSSSSVFQVGSINNITGDARIKHFRKLQS